MKIHCSYDSLVPIGDLMPHPKNPNKHDSAQIKRLAEILCYQGIRLPIIVSELSGCIVSGHGRLEAIRFNGGAAAPVKYQSFEDEDQEFAFLVSDNAIALWAELDLSFINSEIPNLALSDVYLLGIKDFELDISEKKRKPRACPHCGKEI